METTQRVVKDGSLEKNLAARAVPSETQALRLTEETANWEGFKLWKLTLDLPGERVNKLGRALIEQFMPILDQLEALGRDGKIDALALTSGKVGNFMAGADIQMFGEAKTEEAATELSATGQRLASRWEDLPFPTVALVNGVALGGGLELSLASTAIVVSDDPSVRLGLPEVNLGIIPGVGGCIRLPRKVGLATALDMILTGKQLKGDRAAKAGLAEVCLPRQDFEHYACRWVKANFDRLKMGERIAKEPKLGGIGGPIGAVMEKTPIGRAVIFRKAREGVLSKTRGQYPAPLEAIDVLQSTGAAYGEKIRGSAREKALAREARGFGKMAVTDVSRNLIRLFFLTESVKKGNGLPQGQKAKAHEVSSAGVLGAGVMGGGIAQLFADRAVHTRMKDLTNQALSTGVLSATKIFAKSVQRKKITKREMLQKLDQIAPVTDYSGFQSLNLVVEAIVENLEVKKKVLRELEDNISEDCIVASNTSSLSISQMQTAMKNPERFAGMHFFNPVAKMPLIEVIRGTKSSDEAVTTVYQFSKKIGKTPIVVKDSPGFLVNRLLGPYMNEATHLLAEGVPIDEIDGALLRFGMPMGPIELMDEVGLDVAEKVAHIFHEAFGDRMVAAPMVAKVIAAGRLGKKNGKGLYAYTSQKGGRLEKALDPGIPEILGVKPHSRAAEDQEIVDRCVLPQINEAARCLDEGVVADAATVDLGMIMGTGFPPFRGGLLRYADSIGAAEIVDRLKRYEQRTASARFTPSEALLKRVNRNERFHAND